MDVENFVDIKLKRSNLDLYYHRAAIFRALCGSLPLLKGRLLDTACGAMPYRQHILDHSAVSNYVGIDIENAINYDDKVQPDIRWDGVRMPFADATFECAIATEALEHIPDIPLFLAETYRVLKPGGTFFFTTPFLWPLHEIPHDEYRLTPFATKRLLGDANFMEIDIQALGGWNASLAQMLGLWLRRSPMHPYYRRLLSFLLFPFYKYLIRSDTKGSFDHNMITGITGIAVKQT